MGPTLKGMPSSLAATGNGRAMSEAYTPENLVDWMSDPATLAKQLQARQARRARAGAPDG